MHIAVIGDAHIGCRPYNLDSRELDFINSFKDAINRVDKNVPIIIAGDLFNAPRPKAELVYLVEQTLKEHTVFGIVGNPQHDASGSDWLRLCNITLLTQKQTIARSKGRPVVIAGLNWTKPDLFMVELDLLLSTIKGPLDILVLHQLINEFISYDLNQISGAEIAKRLKPFGTKVVVMGDLHQSVNLTIADVQFIYTGSVDVNSISEKYEKSFVVLDISDDPEPTVRFNRVPIKTRPFVHTLIQTEQDIDKILMGVYAMPPFFILEYDNANREIVKLIDSKLAGKHLYRLLPIVKDSKSNLFKQMSSSDADRRDSMRHLRDSIVLFFEPNTDEYNLILQLLELPDEVGALVTAYTKSKGL